jgi:hypothetical protein
MFLLAQKQIFARGKSDLLIQALGREIDMMTYFLVSAVACQCEGVKISREAHGR